MSSVSLCENDIPGSSLDGRNPWSNILSVLKCLALVHPPFWWIRCILCILMPFTPKLMIQILVTIQEQMYEWCSENIDSLISFHLSKLSNAKFSILYDITLVRDWKRKSWLITSGSEIVNPFFLFSCQTPLHMAARNGHLRCLKVLVDAGANMEIKNRQGKTPKHVAMMEQNFECVNYLTTVEGIKTIP